MSHLPRKGSTACAYPATPGLPSRRRSLLLTPQNSTHQVHVLSPPSCLAACTVHVTVTLSPIRLPYYTTDAHKHKVLPRDDTPHNVRPLAPLAATATQELASRNALLVYRGVSHRRVGERLVRLGDLHEHVLRHLVIRVLRQATSAITRAKQPSQPQQ